MTANIWLASYPKSGSTWIRVFLASLLLERPVGINEVHVGLGAAQRGILDAALDVATADLSVAAVEALRPRVYALLAAEAPESLIWKVHDSFHRTSEGTWVFPPGSTRGAVYVVRDPRDVAPSLAHHRGTSVDEAITMMADSAAHLSAAGEGARSQIRQTLGSWSEHVASWLDAPMRIHLVRYEDMLADPLAAFTAIARAVGRDDGPDAITAAIAAADFSRLSLQEWQEGFRERLPEATAPFFRSGRTGGWRSALTAAQARRITADHGPMMRRLGYLPE